MTIKRKEKGIIREFTNSTASLAAKATMSAQETIPGQKISSNLLAESITENPPTELFPGSLFSVPSPCNNIEPSQPYYIYIYTPYQLNIYIYIHVIQLIMNI